MTKKAPATVTKNIINHFLSKAFSGKRVRQNSAKLKAMKKRDRRLRKVTKGKYSIVDFPS